MSDPRLDDLRAALAAQTGRVAAMAPFEALLAEDRARALEADGRKLVGQLCGFVPDELVLAAGALPLRLDSGHLPDDTVPGPMPQDMCCAVRSLARRPDAHPAGLPPMDLTVVPTACDGKRKLAQLWSRDREVFTLELPQHKRAADSRRLWRARMEALVRRLEKLTGQRIKRAGLRRAASLVNRRSELLRAILDLQSADVPPLSGADVFVLIQAGFLSDPNWWCKRAEALLEALQAPSTAPARPRLRARLLVTGSPILWPDLGLPLAIAAAGAEIVADDLCAGSQAFYHPLVPDEDTRGGLIRAAAERVLLPCTCPCFAETGDRLVQLDRLIDTRRVDGVIQHTLRMCQNHDVDAIGLAAHLAERQVPFLHLYTEFGGQESGAMQNRVEAFVEMVSQRQGSGAGPDA